MLGQSQTVISHSEKKGVPCIPVYDLRFVVVTVFLREQFNVLLFEVHKLTYVKEVSLCMVSVLKLGNLYKV